MILISGTPSTCEGEKLFMVKFNLSCSGTSSGQVPTAGSRTALGREEVEEEAPVPLENMSTVTTAVGGSRSRYTYQDLSSVTNNFEKRMDGGGCGSVFQGVLASGTRVVVKRFELGVVVGGGSGISMTDQMWTEIRHRCLL